MKKKVLYFLLVALLLLGMQEKEVFSKQKNLKIVYFSVPLCSSCIEIEKELKDLSLANKNIKIYQYSINDEKGYKLYKLYNEYYGIEESEWKSPVIFVGDKYLYESKSVEHVISEVLENGSETPLLEEKMGDEIVDYNEVFSNYDFITVCLNGLVNGFNPCSLSMLLFFISLLSVKEGKKIKRLGFLFLIGKFIMLVLIGSLLFKYLSYIDFSKYKIIMKSIFCAFLGILIYLNAMDFYNIKRNKLNRIKNQLPKGLRKMNQNIIKNVLNNKTGIILFIASFCLGAVIALGEFLCSGQIYVATLALIIEQHQTGSLLAYIYLIAYVCCFLVPGLIIVLLISRSKDFIKVSSWINNRLHIIKLGNVIILLALLIYMMIFL